MAVAASTAYSTATLFNTGSAPGKPRQAGQICVFGSPPNLFAQPQKALVLVSSWTWTSSPMTGSYRSSTSGETLFAVTVITFDSSNAGAQKGRVFPSQFLVATRHFPDFLAHG